MVFANWPQRVFKRNKVIPAARRPNGVVGRARHAWEFRRPSFDRAGFTVFFVYFGGNFRLRALFDTVTVGRRPRVLGYQAIAKVVRVGR